MPEPTSDPGRKLLALQYMLRIIANSKASQQRRDRLAAFATRYFRADTEAGVTKAVVTKQKGRPSLRGYAMSAAERMRRYRANRAGVDEPLPDDA